MYKLTFRFKSLLPTNFNTYLMTFNEKPVFEEKFEEGNTGHFTTVYDSFVKAAGKTIRDILDGQGQGQEAGQGNQEDFENYKGD